MANKLTVHVDKNRKVTASISFGKGGITLPIDPLIDFAEYGDTMVHHYHVDNIINEVLETYPEEKKDDKDV